MTKKQVCFALLLLILPFANSNAQEFSESDMHIPNQEKINPLVEDFYGKEQYQRLLEENSLDSIFDGKSGHPTILKSYLSGNISLETLVICEKILGYKNNFDKKLNDPVWEIVSMKIKKYSPFIHIDVFRYKKILKEVVLECR